MKVTTQPPRSVPVLTEVVVMPKSAPVPDSEYPTTGFDSGFPATQPAALDEKPAAAPFAALRPAPPPPSPVIDEAALTQRVLADLDKQLDLMFEHRLRETLAPVLARMTDALVREMRNQLALSLREMVARAVALELDRLQKR
ncbi:MAG: hypothetical protein H7Z15_03965 [Rhizobacter sp.]|nr:hypothetical protein [Rhizobacter sp.]